MKNYQYVLRLVLLPDENLEERKKALLEYCAKNAIDDVTFIINAEELSVGFTTVEIAKKHLQALVPVSEALKEIGVTTSINVWESLGHEDRGRIDALHFEHMTDSKGYQSPMTACILSERWLKNYLEVADYICSKLDVNIFWIDDDFRLHNHAPLDFGGCFCELHMKKFCEYLGEDISREEFVKRMLSGGKNRYREAYMQVNMQTYRRVAERIADALQGKCKRIGLMTSDPLMYAIEGRDNRAVLQSFSKNVPCANRVHLAYYLQTSPMLVQWRFNTTSMLSATFNPDYVDILPELENFPHGPQVKSAAFTRMQVENSFALMPKGITQDIYNFTGNGVIESWRYGKYLGELKPYLTKLLSFGISFGDLRGVKIPICAEGALHTMTREGADTLGDLFDPQNYWGGVLGAWGISFCYDFGKKFKNEVVAVSGQWLRSLTYEEAKQLFKDNIVLLSGIAIRTLSDLGWEELAGISRIECKKEKTALYTYEKYLGDQKYLGISGATCSAQVECGDVYEIEYTQDAKCDTLTAMFNCRGEKVFDFITVVNDRVFLFPYADDGYRVGILHPMHAEILRDYLIKHTKNFAVCFEDNVSTYFYEGKDADYCLLCNYSEDIVETPSLALGKEYSAVICYDREDLSGTAIMPKFSGAERRFTVHKNILPLSSMMLVCRKDR